MELIQDVVAGILLLLLAPIFISVVLKQDSSGTFAKDYVDGAIILGGLTLIILITGSIVWAVSRFL